VFADGSGEEILNHMGRHDFLPTFKRSFTNDAALVDFTVASPPRPNANYLNNFYWATGSRGTRGYLGVDARLRHARGRADSEHHGAAVAEP
jgi:hypothetical protein